MAKNYDATAKELLEADPPGWVAFLDLPAGGPVTVANSDVSAVTAAADKVIRVGGPAPYLLHIEFQARRDPGLPGRLLWYNVLIGHRHESPVQSVAVLLRRQANVRSIDGHLVQTQPDGRDYLAFHYLVVRVWEQPVERLLEGPLGLVPLAPIGDVDEARLPEVIRRVGERVGAEADRAEANRLLMATQILTGMRLPEGKVAKLFREVLGMGGIHGIEESSVARALIKRGEAKGLASARHLLIKFATTLIGPPSRTIVKAIDRIDDLDRIEALSDRLPSVKDWKELLADPGPKPGAQ